MDTQSIKNQEIIGELVEREVGTCLTSMVNYILNKSWEDSDAPFSYDDIENNYVNNTKEIEELEEEIESIENRIEEIEDEILCCQVEIDNRREKIEEIEDEILSLEEGIRELNATQGGIGTGDLAKEKEEYREEQELVNNELKDLEKTQEKNEITLQEEQEELESLLEKIKELEEEQEEPQEIYEWWTVSSWLLDKLKEYGEPVIEYENLWGRTTTGQSIKLDWVIGQIALDLEILEGQKHDWSK